IASLGTAHASPDHGRTPEDGGGCVLGPLPAAPGSPLSHGAGSGQRRLPIGAQGLWHPARHGATLCAGGQTSEALAPLAVTGTTPGSARRPRPGLSTRPSTPSCRNRCAHL